MSVLIIGEKPPHFTDVEFEYKEIEFQAQLCLLGNGIVNNGWGSNSVYICADDVPSSFEMLYLQQ